MFKKSIKPLSILLSVVVIMGGVFYITKFVHANSIVVDSTADVIADDGVCTLREAIEKANDTVTGDPHGFVSPGECGVGDPAGLDTITFSSAVFPATITLASTLPAIITPVIIDGISGIPGLSCGDITTPTPKNLGVEIDATTPNNGISINTPNAAGSRIYGLLFRTSVDNVGTGINITDTNTVSVACSMVGLDNAGTTSQAFRTAINIDTNSSDITIGGTNPGDGNVISAHDRGVEIYQSNHINFFQNMIGLNKQGTAVIRTDQGAGIAIRRSDHIVIGGDTPEERNIISGFMGDPSCGGGGPCNLSHGIFFVDAVDSISIQGNYIGTDVTGMNEIPNNISIYSSITGGWAPSTNILIGGHNAGERNVVGSSKDINGYGYNSLIDIEGANGVDVYGNLFGIKADESALVTGNEGGVLFSDNTQNIRVGDTGPNDRNYFGASGLQFITTDTFFVKNNLFGFLPDGITPTPGFMGIQVQPGTNGVIGGTTPAEGNIIANEGFAGIFLTGVTSNVLIQNNTIHDNSTGIIVASYTSAPPFLPFLVGSAQAAIIDNKIYNNTELGINLYEAALSPTFVTIFSSHSPFGPNLNDISDSDSGPNNNLNYPVIHSITESPLGTLNLNYYLDVPAGSYRVEFYKNPTAGLDSSYHGEGEEFVFADTFTSSGTIGVKTVTFPGSLTDVITPTATECTDGTCTAYVRTSEFGPTVPITAGGGSGAGLDFGDVATNQTTALNNGAYHILNTNYLGSCIDADTGTVQNTAATSDDTTAPTDPSAIVGVCATANDDEDGVVFDKVTYTIGDSAVLTVTANAPGIVNVWVDTNTNGSFLDVGEQVLVNAAVVAGPNTLTGFTVPATNGTYPLRVRYVSDISKTYQETPGTASPRGEALDGEVEDYNLQVGAVVVPPPPSSGGGGSTGGTTDLCINVNGIQTIVPTGYSKVPADPTIAGVCTQSTATDQCPNISGIQQVVPNGYTKKSDGYCYPPTEKKEYTVKIYPLEETGVTPPPTSDMCPYFSKYLKLGKKNDTTEVIKWQNFLNTHMKEKLEVNGVYNTETVNAVKRFQDNYKSDVLIPWGLKKPTGWTYKTTRMKANQIVGCLEKPVYLEIPGISWVLGALKK